MGSFDFFAETVGVDPGSQNLRILQHGKIAFDEPTIISIDLAANKVLGFGHSASPAPLVVKPVNYVIEDFQAFELLIRGALKKISPRSWFPKTYIMYFCIPTTATEVDRRAYRDSAEHAGAKEVYMLFQSCAAALSMNILSEKKHFIIIDFSASKVEITVFANGLIISDGYVRYGVGKIIKLLRNHFFRAHQLTVTDKEIEALLHSLEDESLSEIEIQFTVIKTEEIHRVLASYFSLVNDEIMEVMERVSRHADIGQVMLNGVYFTGGGSAIEYLRNQIELGKRVKSTVSKTPLHDSINGLQIVMADKKKYKNYLLT